MNEDHPTGRVKRPSDVTRVNGLRSKRVRRRSDPVERHGARVDYPGPPPSKRDKRYLRFGQ